MKKKRTKTSLRKEADRLCSLYIRLRDRDEMGLTHCFTCPWKADMKKAQCGHFAPRQHLGTRYLEKNLAAQCYVCNMLHNGEPSKFASRLIEKYGTGVIAEIERERLKTFPSFDYQAVIETFSKKLEELGMAYLI